MFWAQSNLHYTTHQDRPLNNKPTNLQSQQSAYADPGLGGAAPTLTSLCGPQRSTNQIPSKLPKKHTLSLIHIWEVFLPFDHSIY